jgi:hypothetical protein
MILLWINIDLLLFCIKTTAIINSLIRTGHKVSVADRILVVMGKLNKPASPRNKQVSIWLNKDEYRTLEKYCSKYRIKNRSQFIRQTVMKTVIDRLCLDYPTLFEEKKANSREID